MEEMKDIFVVDGDLKIYHPVQVSALEWKQGVERHFWAEVGGITRLVRRGGWDKYSRNAGFETNKEAEAFKLSSRELLGLEVKTQHFMRESVVVLSPRVRRLMRLKRGEVRKQSFELD